MLNPNPENNDPPLPAKTVAVIDVGATSIRMQISEILPQGNIRKVETLIHGVSIGRDSFSVNSITKPTIEECIRVLKIYRAKLQEYGIELSKVRAVATSGVREATNRVAFQDRIYMATGIDVEAFDEAELHRVTYLGIQPYFDLHPQTFSGRTLVCEVGGGTTEMLLLQEIDVWLARTFRLGSLRLRKALESYDAPAAKNKRLLESQIRQFVQQIYHVCEEKPAQYIAMGGDIRFLLSQLNIKVPENSLAELSIDDLRNFTYQLLPIEPDRLAIKYHISLSEAESLAPALYAHLMIAEAFFSEKILVANVNLRDSLVKEIAQGYGWSESVQSQIVRSALRLGKRYDVDQGHAQHVAFLACQLFEKLSSIHGLEDRHKLTLHLAALLHEIGSYVNIKSYHKHTMYLIQNSDFFGVNAHELMLMSLVARYHRRAMPLQSHEGYSTLRRDDRILVSKLASILRIAVALDCTRQQRIEAFECQVSGTNVQILVDGIQDLAIESTELIPGAKMFEDLFGMKVSLVSRQYE